MTPERQKDSDAGDLGRPGDRTLRDQAGAMIVEDAHWIDPTTQESVDLTIGRAEEPGSWWW